MAEDDGLPAAPVVVVDLCAILGGNRAHGVRSFFALREDVSSDSCAVLGGRHVIRGRSSASNWQQFNRFAPVVTLESAHSGTQLQSTWNVQIFRISFRIR